MQGDVVNVYWWLLSLMALLLANHVAVTKGPALILRLTGRESHRPVGSRMQLELYDLLYVGVSLGIGLPPIFLLPNADPLVWVFFWTLGFNVGSLTAQAVLGRKRSTEQA